MRNLPLTSNPSPKGRGRSNLHSPFRRGDEGEIIPSLYRREVGGEVLFSFFISLAAGCEIILIKGEGT